MSTGVGLCPGAFLCLSQLLVHHEVKNLAPLLIAMAPKPPEEVLHWLC
jgi:hypothetical protein